VPVPGVWLLFVANVRFSRSLLGIWRNLGRCAGDSVGVVSFDEEIGDSGRDGKRDKIRGRRLGLRKEFPVLLGFEYDVGNISSTALAVSWLVVEESTSLSPDCKSTNIGDWWSCMLLEMESIDSRIGDRRGFKEDGSLLVGQIVPLAFIMS